MCKCAVFAGFSSINDYIETRITVQKIGLSSRPFLSCFNFNMNARLSAKFLL